MTVVWRRKHDGQLFYASDHGCSCPSPFEDEGVEDLTEASAFEISNYLLDMAKKEANRYNYTDDENDVPSRVKMEVLELIGKIVNDN